MQKTPVRFHLDPDLLTSVRAGQHNFFAKVTEVVQEAGLTVELLENSPQGRIAVATLPGYDLFHMDAPTHDRALTVRRVYHYPFWAIERSAQRWNWHVAGQDFPATGDPDAATRFARFWRKRLFGNRSTGHDGYVYIPLQGRIREHRSFQTCAPIDMIAATLRHDPVRPVIATLHPNEIYDAADIQALEDLARQHPRLSIAKGDMAQHLAACDYVVTQNSSAAFNGYFFAKPCVLFARIDFHHIAANVADLGEPAAFAEVTRMRPDYAGYLHWFWQVMAINAGRPEAEAQIAAALRRGGWPV
ncbi:hypothetical protein [Pseudooceanicola sp.]|uniref:hypothetical protein n=1 Tax=Pseudooceanicola sp. TaxID=1914328 RepID=UPI0026183581|nr:hypothetical protein [Pseudooceanicola sp.]